MDRKPLGLALAILLCIAPPLLAAPVEQTIPITFNTGLPAGKYFFTFRLYTEATGGSPVWQESPAAKITVGATHLASHRLGSKTPFTSGTAGPVDFTKQLWVAPSKGIKNYARFKLPISVFSLATSGLRVVPNQVSPNLIGGHPENTIAAGVIGAVIGGGGVASDPANPTRPTFNEILGDFGVIAGGKRNKSASYGFVGGGSENQATGWFNVLGGGENNVTSGDYAAILGGWGNEASGLNASILGGTGGQATGNNSSVLGGSGNHATGDHAIVAGGCSNDAQGYRSFAAGEDALASMSGMFVWAASDDSLGGVYEQDGHFPPASLDGGTTPNPLLADMQFWAKAPGGVFFVNGVDGTGSPLGVMLPAGAQAWEPITPPVSDVNLKRDFAGVDGRVVLEKLATVPVSTWSYRNDRAETRHIGPMAQDFAAAFGVGKDNRHIDPIDSAGVSLAALQGLYSLVRELQERVSTQERELAAERAGSTALRARLDELALRYTELRLLIAGSPARDGSLAAK